MVYGTCTILRSENEDVVDMFWPITQISSWYQHYTAYDLDARDDRGMVHMFPDDFESDGFFIATLQKKQA